MTCIAGVQHDGQVWLAGDSAGVGGYSISVRADEKVFTRDGYAFGFTSSFRMGQILRYDAELPDSDDRRVRKDPDGFMVSWFIPAVRKALQDGGFSTIRNNEEIGGTFLVGLGARLFEVHNDFQVGRNRNGYSAVGCGDDLALGSLHTTHEQRRDIHPASRLRFALRAAAAHSAGVVAPFKVVST